LTIKDLGRWEGGMRKLLCWAGVIFIVIIMLSASRYDVPVTAGPREYGGDVWVEEKDYSNVPWWVKMGSEYWFFTVMAGGFFLYGALKK